MKAEQGSDDKKASGDTQRLIETLGSADFAQRDKAIEKLRALGDKAVPALEDASKNAKDSEVRWNARRVLREIRDDAVSAKAPRAARSEKAQPSDPNDRDDLSIPLQELSPGIAIARSGRAPIDVERLQQEMQKRMEEMVRRQMQIQGIEPGASMPSLDWLRSQGGNTIRLGGGRLNGGRMDGGGASTEIRMENGNVKVSIRKTDKDGKEETKTYEAPSMEEFKEKYPEVAKEYLGNVRILSQGGKLGLNLGAGAGAKAHDKSKSTDRDIDENEDSDSTADFDSSMDIDSSMDLDSKNGIDLGKAGSLVLGSRPFGGSADLARLIGPENGERLGVSVRAAGASSPISLAFPPAADSW